MKVIFLDHGGVMSLEPQWGSRFEKKGNKKTYTTSVLERLDDFSRECVDSLNRTIKATDCEIVVSSDWRAWATLEEMQEYYTHQGVHKKPIAYTPFPYVGEISTNNKKVVMENIRSLEIKKWLDSNPTDSWIAIDSMNLVDADLWEWELENFIHCPSNGFPTVEQNVISKLSPAV